MPPIFVPMFSQKMFLINILYFFELSMMSNKIGESTSWCQRYGHLHF